MGLEIGERVPLLNGQTCTVQKALGSGGQGTVYIVEYQGTNYALKWYHEHWVKDPNNTTFYNNLTANTAKPAPAPNFLWPLAMTQVYKGSYGYLMRLKSDGFEELTKFLVPKPVQFASIEAQFEACMQICEAFQRLHIMGYSYRDLNAGGFFINPETGDVEIADTDNVAPDNTIASIGGVPMFMAPEVVMQRVRPNTLTDYHSLAVTLFLILYRHNPMEGRYSLRDEAPIDNRARNREMYGDQAVFVMDPTNDRNRPLASSFLNQLWSAFPSYLGQRFERAFCREALTDPSKRILDNQWFKYMVQARALWGKCPKCGNFTFIDIVKGGHPCYYCHERQHPMILNINGYYIPIVEGQKIYKCQVSNSHDHRTVVGQIVRHHDMIGLYNPTDLLWSVQRPDGAVAMIKAKHGVPLYPKYQVKYNNGIAGTIH